MVALPLLILIVLFAPLDLFNLLVTTVSALALYEFYTMVLPAERSAERLLATVTGAVLTAFLCWRQHEAGLLVLGGLFLFYALWFLFRYRDLNTVVAQLGLTLLGILYLPLMLSYLARLRGLDGGTEWVFLVLALVMAGDSAAYFVGSSIGKRPLYPAISPNKSVEGAIGGLAGSLLAALLFARLFAPDISLATAAVVAVVVGIFSQLGDLFESMLKRSCGVKDSGSMIPGHGGLLDRLDSLLFAFPSAYCLAIVLGF